GGDAFCFVIIAADQDVAVDRPRLREQFGAQVVKRRRDYHGCRDKFARLLCRGTLPNVEHPRWRAADGCGEGHGRVNEDLSRLPVRLELFQERRLTGKGNCQYDDFALREGGGVVRAFNLCVGTEARAKNFRGFGGAVRVARTDDDLLAGSGPTRCEPRTFRAGPAENSNFSAHGSSISADGWCRTGAGTCWMGTRFPVEST